MGVHKLHGKKHTVIYHDIHHSGTTHLLGLRCQQCPEELLSGTCQSSTGSVLVDRIMDGELYYNYPPLRWRTTYSVVGPQQVSPSFLKLYDNEHQYDVYWSPVLIRELAYNSWTSCCWTSPPFFSD